LDVQEQLLVAVEAPAVVAPQPRFTPQEQLIVPVQVVAPLLLGVQDEGLAQSKDVMTEIDPRQDVLSGTGQKTSRGGDLDLSVGRLRPVEPAPVSSEDEDVVVLVPQKGRGDPQRCGPGVPQVDVLVPIELVEMAHTLEADVARIVLCLQDAEAAVLRKGDVAGPADRRQRRKRRLTGLSVEQIILNAETPG